MLISPKELKRLQSIKNQYPCVSIYIPTHRAVPEKEQDRIRVKNLIKKAENKLKQEFTHHDIEKVLDNLDKLKDSIDYENELDSLVIFANKNGGALYYLPEKLPEQLVIDQNFETRALERFLDRNFYYWVLALSQKPTRLFMGFNNYLLEVDDSQIGKDQSGPYPRLWEYDVTEPWSGFPYKHNYDVKSDRALEAVGTGDKDSGYLDSLKKQFFKEVDQLLSYHVQKENIAPIIVLGTPNDRATFDQISQFKKNIIGQNGGDFSHKNFSKNKILEQVKPVIKEYQSKKEDTALKNLSEAIGTLHYASGFDWVWRVAKEGRVRTLILEENYKVPGIVDENNEFKLINNSDITGDLIDSLIELVKSKDGDIIFTKPEKLKKYNHIAAILRY